MKYFIYMDGQTYGPFSFIKMTEMPILEDTMICTDASDGEWKEAREYTEFLHLFQTLGAVTDEHVAPSQVVNPANSQPSQPQPPEPVPESQPQQAENVPESQPQQTESAVTTQYQVTQLPVGYEINEFGEIIRKDYAFRSAKKRPDAPLPTNRGYLETIAITIVTCGIYGIILPFLMGEETNITCDGDGEETSGFWGTLFASLFTCGIYGLVYNRNWCNREARFLEKHKSIPILTGNGYLISSVFSVLTIVGGLVSIDYRIEELGIIAILLGIILFLTRVGRFNIQHNLVNKAYNVENFLQEQGFEGE